jgi:hypothetical protein
MHLPRKRLGSRKPTTALGGQQLESPAERPIQLACVFVTLIAIAIYYFSVRPTASSFPVDTRSLDYLLAQCHTGRDSTWRRECERHTRAEDKKRKESR